MSGVGELLERVKAAAGPDRELDAEIFAWSQGGRIHYFDAAAKNYVWERPIDGFWIRSVKSVPSTTKFTASLDAVLGLCEPKGWRLFMVDASINGRFNVLLATAPTPQWSEELQTEVTIPHYASGVHNEFPIAVLTALLVSEQTREESIGKANG